MRACQRIGLVGHVVIGIWPGNVIPPPAVVIHRANIQMRWELGACSISDGIGCVEVAQLRQPAVAVDDEPAAGDAEQSLHRVEAGVGGLV
jgi:hypothetical protein